MTIWSLSLICPTGTEPGIERLAVDETRARSADVEPAAVLRAMDTEVVTQDPEQPDIVRTFDVDALAVDEECVLGHLGFLS